MNSHIDPYKYGKQIVKKTFHELDKEVTMSYATNETHFAVAAAKRGLVALVKENPKDFYTRAGKGHLAHLKRTDSLNTFTSTPLTSTLLNAARTDTYAKNIDKFKAHVKNSPSLTF
jgi:hypothetical protein